MQTTFAIVIFEFNAIPPTQRGGPFFFFVRTAEIPPPRRPKKKRSNVHLFPKRCPVKGEIQKSIARLHNFAFVGLVEKWDRSICLLVLCSTHHAGM